MTTKAKEKDALDLTTLKAVMSAPFESFEHLGQTFSDGRGNRHIYINRGSHVLGVAHLDSVRPYSGFWMNEQYICCATIDNRIGAWLMLYGLPSMGIQPDVLLTENEERGRSTAIDFMPSKPYNWGFSFDRTGDDVVYYHYHDDVLQKRLEKCEFEVSWGSYSDISDLDIGVKCVNFGCGMHNYHSDFAYIEMPQLLSNLKKFRKFWSDYSHVTMTHTKDQYYGGLGEDDFSWMDYRKSTGKQPISMSKWEWDEYDGTDVATTYSYPSKTYGYDVLAFRKWGAIDTYLAKQAHAAPDMFFDGHWIPKDWESEHQIADINDVDGTDKISDLYFDGTIVMCENCEMLYARGDVEYYKSLSGKFCKACFFRATQHDKTWMNS